MDETVEAAGALTTAAVAAATLDPAAARTEIDRGDCLNCGAALAGAYCSACGQKAHLHRSVLHAVEEFLHGVVHFDSKFWHTLPLLVVRPGKLTRDYVHGRRARYISPVALFLLTIFAMFFVFGLQGAGPGPGDVRLAGTPKQQVQALEQAEAALAGLETELAAARADPARTTEVAGLEVARRGALALRDRLRDGRAIGAPDGAGLASAIGEAVAKDGLVVDMGNTDLNAKIRKSLKDTEFVFYKMKQKGYKLSFLLVPMSLPWMILLFAWKRDVHVYDHVVFLLYSISFMSLLFMAVALLGVVGVGLEDLYPLLVLVIPFAHILVQLKEAYRLGWPSAAWRAVALSGFAVVTLAIYFVGILLLGLLD